MFSRREVCSGGLVLLFGSAIATCCPRHASAQNAILGCSIPEDEADSFFDRATESRLFATGNEPMIPKSGDRNFDLALAQTLAKISRVLEASPGFAYYDDYDGQNAYATPAVRLNGADGTVLFGQGFLGRLRSGPESPDVAVAAVCAHEFGHILQYKRGLDRIVGAGQPTVKRVELQADFFAGYFAGIRKLEKPSFPAAVFAMTQHAMGDNMINHPNHHGTPQQRAAAIVRGFEVAKTERKSLADAIQVSINYVSTL